MLTTKKYYVKYIIITIEWITERPNVPHKHTRIRFLFIVIGVNNNCGSSWI